MESQGGENQEEKSQISKSEMVKDVEKEPIFVSLREKPTGEQITELTELMKKI